MYVDLPPSVRQWIFLLQNNIGQTNLFLPDVILTRSSCKFETKDKYKTSGSCLWSVQEEGEHKQTSELEETLHHEGGIPVPAEEVMILAVATVLKQTLFIVYSNLSTR